MKKKRKINIRFTYLTITKYGLIAFALMRLYSIWLYAHATSMNMMMLVQSNLQYNMLFMISMFDILCCLYLFYVSKQIREGNLLERNMGIIYIITLTQILMMNPIISILLLLTIYSLQTQLYLSFKKLFIIWCKKENRLSLLTISFLCIFFSSFIYLSFNTL